MEKLSQLVGIPQIQFISKMAGEMVRGDVEYADERGRRFFHNVVAPFRVGGELRGILGFNIDITERKQAEEALRKSEALYRQAIEVANAVPYHQTYGEDGRTMDYDFIGEGIRQITGYEPEEFNEPLWDSLAQERVLLDDLASYSYEESVAQVRSGTHPVWKCNHRIRAREWKHPLDF